jgi:signal transduction histidine kinase
LTFISFRTKFTIITVLLSTIATGLLGGYLVWKSYGSLRLQAQEAELALAKSMAWQVNHGLSRAFQAVEALSRKPEMSGTQRLAMISELNLVTNDTELLDGLVIYDLNGRPIARSILSLSVKDLPPDSFIRENVARAGELKGSVLVRVYQTPSRNWGVGISAPIWNGSRLKGILVGLLYLPNHTIGDLKTAQIGKSGYVYLMDDQSEPLVQPDETTLAEAPLPNPAVLALRSQREGVAQFRDANGQEILAAYAAVPSANWGVVVRESAQECYAPADHMLKFMTFFLGISLLFTLILALSVSKRMVEPLLRLTQRVQAYKTDSPPNRFSDPGDFPQDEIGILNQALGSMARRIQIDAQAREKALLRALQFERKLSESERLAAIGQLAAGLAHELNNPLTVILGSAQLARESKGKVLRQWIDTILKESERCQRLVRDLLDFARPRKLRFRKIDLVLLVRQTWQQLDMGSSAAQKLELREGAFVARVDPDRFKQVVINIFSNAREAMRSEGTVTVVFQRKGRMALMSVRDQGEGFKLKNSEVLFRPFFTTKSSGTGLGLAIARAIMQSHGGRIWATRNKPRGSIFHLRWKG